MFGFVFLFALQCKGRDQDEATRQRGERHAPDEDDAECAALPLLPGKLSEGHGDTETLMMIC